MPVWGPGEPAVQALRRNPTDAQDAVGTPEWKKDGSKVRANVPINRPWCDLYCADHTSGPRVSEITVLVQITVRASNLREAMNRSANLTAGIDRIF
jgi:hypothetical protein